MEESKKIDKDEIKKLLLEIIESRTPYLSEEELKMADDLFGSLGYDSLTVMELLMEIETKFDITIDYSFDFNEYKNVEMISEYIHERICAKNE